MNILDLVNIPKLALAELVGNEELVKKNISGEFFSKEYLHLVNGLVVSVAVGSLTNLNLVPRLIFLAV
jgi:hypothetical protein